MLQRRVPDILPEDVELDVFIVSPLAAALEVRFRLVSTSLRDIHILALTCCLVSDLEGGICLRAASFFHVVGDALSYPY